MLSTFLIMIVIPIPFIIIFRARRSAYLRASDEQKAAMRAPKAVGLKVCAAIFVAMAILQTVLYLSMNQPSSSSLLVPVFSWVAAGFLLIAAFVGQKK